MKSLNHDTRHFSRHDSDDKKMADDEDANAFMRKRDKICSNPE